MIEFTRRYYITASNGDMGETKSLSGLLHNLLPTSLALFLWGDLYRVTRMVK